MIGCPDRYGNQNNGIFIASARSWVRLLRQFEPSGESSSGEKRSYGRIDPKVASIRREILSIPADLAPALDPAGYLTSSE